MAGGRKPAQPSIPEGILGFPPPDAVLQCIWKTKAKVLKSNTPIPRVPGKNLLGGSKISVVLSRAARVSLSFAVPYVNRSSQGSRQVQWLFGFVVICVYLCSSVDEPALGGPAASAREA